MHEDMIVILYLFIPQPKPEAGSSVLSVVGNPVHGNIFTAHQLSYFVDCTKNSPLISSFSVQLRRAKRGLYLQYKHLLILMPGEYPTDILSWPGQSLRGHFLHKLDYNFHWSMKLIPGCWYDRIILLPDGLGITVGAIGSHDDITGNLWEWSLLILLTAAVQCKKNLVSVQSWNNILWMLFWLKVVDQLTRI